MPFEKGNTLGQGRPKGSVNKDPLALEERALAAGVDIFAIALQFAVADWEGLGYENEVYHKETPAGEVKMGYVISPEMRLRAVETLMKYVYPQKKALEVSGGENALKIVIEDYTK
jgi:hypothetical protein